VLLPRKQSLREIGTDAGGPDCHLPNFKYNTVVMTKSKYYKIVSAAVPGTHRCLAGKLECSYRKQKVWYVPILKSLFPGYGKEMPITAPNLTLDHNSTEFGQTTVFKCEWQSDRGWPLPLDKTERAKKERERASERRVRCRETDSHYISQCAPGRVYFCSHFISSRGRPTCLHQVEGLKFEGWTLKVEEGLTIKGFED